MLFVVLSNVFFNMCIFLGGIVYANSQSFNDLVVWITKNVVLTSPSSLEKHSFNIYKLYYYFRGKKYTLYLTIKRGPPTIRKVLNELNEECTEEMESVLGPNRDFHQHTVYPVHKQFSGYTFYDREDRPIEI